MTNKRKIRRFKMMQTKAARRVEFQKAIDEMERLKMEIIDVPKTIVDDIGRTMDECLNGIRLYFAGFNNEVLKIVKELLKVDIT